MSSDTIAPPSPHPPLAGADAADPSSRLLGPVLVQGAGTLVNVVVGMVVLLVLGRLLGPERFGGYVAVLSAAVVALTVLEGGWPTRIYRDTAGTDDGHARPLVGAALGYLLLAVGVVGAALLPFVDTPGSHLAALACMALVAMMNLVSARMRAAGRFALEAVWQVSGRLASAALIVAGVAWMAATVTGVFVYWGLGLLLVLAVGARRWLAMPTWLGLRAALPVALPFLVVEVLAALLLKGDVAIAGWVGAEGQALSFYAACTRLNEAALLLFAPVANVLLRSLRLHADDRVGFSRLWRGGVALAAISGGAMVLGGWLVGEPLMALMFGVEFAAAGAVLPYTAAMLPFALGNLVLIQAVIAQGQERRLVLMLLPAAGALLGGAWIGWRAGGAAGAGLGLASAHAALWCLAVGSLVVLARRRAGATTGHPR